MKQNLLLIVQDMLGAIDAEEVQDIGETEESGQCVQIANRMFEKIIYHKRWKHIRGYERLVTTTALNEMLPPEGTVAFKPNEVYYDSKPIYYLDPDEFRRLTISRDSSLANIQEINDIKVYTDRDPQFWTSDDDSTLIFDAVPDALNGLNASKSRIIGWFAPTERLTENGDIFHLPAQLFPVLKDMCIGTAKAELKGDTQNAQLDIAMAQRGLARLSRNARLVDDVPSLNTYVVPRRSTYHARSLNY